MSKQKYIDWDKRTILGYSGTIYKIEPENLSTGRFNEFVIQGNLLAWQCNFEELYAKWQEVEQLATAGNDIIGNLTKIGRIAVNVLKALAGFVNNEPPKVIKYCSLVCTLPGEDMRFYDPVLTKQKYEDWRHIPIDDFFLLQSKLTKGFIPNLKRLEAKQNQMQNQITDQ